MTFAEAFSDARVLVAIAAVVTIALVHVASVPLIRSAPELASRLKDLTSGIALGYVFLYLLPKIGVATDKLKQELPSDTPEFLYYRYYLYLMLGFLVYYVAFPEQGTEERKKARKLYFDVAVFYSYNMLVAITAIHLGRAHHSAHAIIAALFMLHLFGINFALTKWHGPAIYPWIRSAFTASLVLGIFMGISLEPGNRFVMIATSFVGGVIIILSTRIKLPSKDVIDRLPFLAGVLLAILLAYLGRSIEKL